MSETEQKTGVVTGAYLKVGVIEITRSQFQDLASGKGVDDEELPVLKQKLFDDRHFSGFAFSSYGPQFRFSWSGGLAWTELELVEALRQEIKSGMVTSSINKQKWSGLFEQIFLIYKWKTCGFTLPRELLAAVR